MLLVLLAAALAGAQSFQRTVIVMRHCVRSTETTFTDEPYPCVARSCSMRNCARLSSAKSHEKLAEII